MSKTGSEFFRPFFQNDIGKYYLFQNAFDKYYHNKVYPVEAEKELQQEFLEELYDKVEEKKEQVKSLRQIGRVLRDERDLLRSGLKEVIEDGAYKIITPSKFYVTSTLKPIANLYYTDPEVKKVLDSDKVQRDIILKSTRKDAETIRKLVPDYAGAGGAFGGILVDPSAMVVKNRFKRKGYIEMSNSLFGLVYAK